MGKLTLFRKALWLVLAGCLAVPGAAQSKLQRLPAATPADAAAALPASYPETSGIPRARPDKTELLRVREQARADAAEAACTAGDQQACAALGHAFLYGEGRLQSRPVAALILNEACAAQSGAGCHWLGVMQDAAVNPPLREAARASWQRACDLGSLDGCAALADVLEGGFGMPGPDPAAGAMLRRQTCARGHAAACRRLAQTTLEVASDPAERAAALGVLQSQCRMLEGEACELLLTPARIGQVAADEPAADRREWLDLACRAEDGMACQELGLIVFAEETGLPEQRSIALGLFDRGCNLLARLCDIPAEIRARPRLAATCAAGNQRDCAALGRSFDYSTSPLYDPQAALRLLGGACDGGVVDACVPAAKLARGPGQPDPALGARQMARWFAIACEADTDLACETFARHLLAGDGVPQDRPRGYRLLARVCERGNHSICEELETMVSRDPDAPLLTADSRFSPPLTPEEEEQQKLADAREREAERLANRAMDCTTTMVSFRGLSFDDTLCDRTTRIRRGQRMRPGNAPWQALLWRPEQRAGATLNPAERVLCGGAVIGEGWMLTAAHCLYDDGQRIDGKGYRVRTGVYNPREREGISHRIIRTIAHPNYNPLTHAFDIALVQFDQRGGQRSPIVHPIAAIRLDPLGMNQRPIRAGAPVFTYGWGWTEATNSGSTDHLRGVRMGLTSPEDCERITAYRGRLLGAALCAGGGDQGQACKGDSGGPLVIFSDPDKLPTVIGVLSSGRECGATGEASRYARVARVRQWIDRQLALPR